MDFVVRYSRWRAVWSLAVPILALSIPMANWLIDPSDFRSRYADKWIGTVGIAVGILWFVYALWPDAFRLLSGGATEIHISGPKLWTNKGTDWDLRLVDRMEVMRSPLRRPRVLIRCPEGEIIIDTAFQAIGQGKSADEIAKAVFDGSGRPFI